MRRKDREVSDINDILSIIDKCDSCNLGLSLNNIPYIVPLNFGYEYKDGKLVLYFHGAREGKKLDIIKENANACFSMDCLHEFVIKEEAASATMKYESVMGTGKIEIVTDNAEKLTGLLILMKHYTPDCKFSIPDRVLDITCVFKLNVENFTGKRNIG